MTRFFVHDTEALAQASADAIDVRIRQLVQPSRLDADGNLIGVNAATGLPDAAAAKTETWDNPRQRLDGKWIILHPEVSSVGSNPAGNTGMTIAAYLTQDLSAISIASDSQDGTWFALPIGHT